MHKKSVILTVLGVSSSLLILAVLHQHASRSLRRSVKTSVGVDSYDVTQIPNTKAAETSWLEHNKNSNFFQRIVYNRVGKCGSRSMLTLISSLSKRNNFTYYSSSVSNITKPLFMDLVDEVKMINGLQAPYLYSRHIHYIDFAKYGMASPVYINMVRDPIERFSSQYFFQRYGDHNKPQGRRAIPWKKGEKAMDINDCILLNHPTCSAEKTFYIVPYFCGQDIMCQKPSELSLLRAKIHLMENYLIVGYLEDFVGMLQVLEKVIPSYFTGSLKLWSALSSKRISTSTLHKEAINATAYRVLKQRMKVEYDFYNFARSRFNIIKRQLGITDIKLWPTV